ncbi:MAG: hypothetical protein ABI388_09670, partial [Bacteroidia bacterium]
MKQLLSYRKIFGAKLNLLALLLAISFTTYAQNRLINPNHNRYLDRSVNQNLTAKTAATATCPTSPVTLGCQDSTNIVNGTATTIANNSTLACNNQSIVIYSNGGSVSNENTPCVSTIYSPYYTNVRNQVTETFYEGGQNIGCVGPTGCSFPIGGTPNLSISGVTNWSVLIGYLDPTLQHDFTFCRAGNITATSVSLQDCWTGATLAGPVPLSNASAAPCFTMTLPANTDIGTANYSIAPASASASLINYGDGEAQIKTYMLPAGTYTVTYTFTPPVSSGCGPVTGTYKFTVGPNPTVSVTSPTVCAGITPTITASGTSTSYSWSPSTNLSASTGSVVTYNGSTSTTYTVTGMKGGCTSLPATSTITINPTPTVTVNSPSICPGATATLTASGATTYSWSAGLSATTGGSVTATPASATVYTVTGTSLTCTSSATATITISPTPTVSVNSPSICPGGTATLIASGATTYSWSAGLSATTGGSVTATPASATVYTVTGTASTCTSSATATVSIIPTVTITATSATVCPGGTGTLTASGASTYTWTPVTGLTPATGGTVQANPSSTTVYTITGADINNCLASPGTATLTISAIGSLVVSNDTS